MKRWAWISGFITGLFAFPLCALISISIGQGIVTGRYLDSIIVILSCCGAVVLIGWLSWTVIAKD